MSYIEGTASNQFELLGVIKTFLEDNGWTVNLYQQDTYAFNHAEQSSDAKRLHVSKNGTYLNFRSTDGANPTSTYYVYNMHCYGILFNISSGFDAAEKWHEQPGYPTYISDGAALTSYIHMNNQASYRIFLFEDPFTLLVYIKHSSLNFGQMYFSEVSDKYGVWPGGKMFLSSTKIGAYDDSIDYNQNFLSSGIDTGSSHSGFKGAINIQDNSLVSSGTTWPVVDGGEDAVFYPYIGKARSNTFSQDGHGLYVMQLNAMPSAFTSPSILLPIQSGLKRVGTSKISLLGELPYLKLTTCAIEDMEKIVTYGGKNYIILPICTPVSGQVNPCVAVEYEGA